MTFAVTTTFAAIPIVLGASSIIIGNPSGNDPIQVTQRFPVDGATEEADPTTDPGFEIAAGSAIVLPFAQTVFVRGDSSQNITVCPFA